MNQSEGKVAVGLFERVGPFRYRLVLPWRGDNKLAVVELVPAPEQ